MCEISEFTELKNDAACDFVPECVNQYDYVNCPKCSSNDVSMDKGTYTCNNCGEKFETEKFLLD